MPFAPRRAGLARRVRLAALAAAVALALTTCSTESPIGPGRPGIGSVRVAPLFNAWSRMAPLTLDNVRVIVVRPPSDTLADVARPFSVDSDQLTLNIPVPLLGASEDLEVTLELFAGTTLLFRGTQTVTVTQGTNPPTSSIPLTFQGPGAQVASIAIGPRDTTVGFGAVFSLGATAQDSQQAPVAQFYVGWSASAGTINAAGQFTAPLARDTVTITATTPTGISDQTTVIVAAPAATLVRVSGDAQSGVVGSRLPLPLVVRVDGSDALPVSGVPVTFAATLGGGSVDSATVITDGAGLASMGATLGATVGAQSFTASAPGLTAVTFAATGISGAVKTWTGATSTAWTTNSNWSPAIVPAAGDSVVVPAGTPNDPTLSGNATIGALALTGTGASVTIAGNLTVTSGIALPDTNQFVQVNSGGITAGTLVLAGYQAFIDASGGNLAVSGASQLTGNRSFVDATGAGSHSLGPVTLAGSQAFLDLAGGSTGPITVSGADAFFGAAGTVTVNGSLQLTGNASFATTSMLVPSVVTVTGNVVIGGTGGFLSPGNGGSRIIVNGNLQTTGTGYLAQSFASDTVIVNGDVSFGGGDESFRLNAGALMVVGDFTQTGVATSFRGSGTHTVFLAGAGPQVVNFATPGFSASRFQNVVIANTTGQVQVTSDLYTSGQAGVTNTVPRILSGTGGTLFTTILDVSNFTFNNLLLNFSGSTVFSFDTVTFQGYAPTATPLTISHPGAASPLTFLDVTFTVAPTTGFYLSATDTGPTDGVPLVIDMVSPSPASPAGRVQTAGGATVNWAITGPATWTGAASTNWSDPANWSTGAVPTSAEDVVIPGGTPLATVTSSCSARSITINSGGGLDLGSFNCQVQGDVLSDGGIIGTGAIQILAAGQVRGNFSNLTIAAPVTVNAATGISGGLVVTGATGRLLLNGQTVVTGGNFATQGGARLVMLNPADALGIGGSASFDGGAELDSLTAGVITIGGNFTQAATTSGDSYHPSGTHVTILVGTSPTVTFATPGDVPGTSHFQELSWNGTGTLQLGSPVFAHGTFTVASAAGFQAAAPRRLQVGNLFTAGPLTFTNVLLGISQAAPVPVTLSNLTFQGVPPESTQVIVRHPGLAAASLAWSGLTFSVVPTTGFYLRAEDANTSDGTTLVVDISGSSPTSGLPFVQQISGAIVNWPAAAQTRTWAGAVDTDWFTPGNWVGGVAPLTTDNAVIPAGTPNSPTIGASTTINDLTVQPGAILNLGDIGITVTGNLDAMGLIQGCCGDGVDVRGNVRGNLSEIILTVSAGQVATLNGPVTFGAGTSQVRIDGELVLNGNLLNAGQGTVTTLNGIGLLTMTNPADFVIAGFADFQGGNQTGRLTAGTLQTQSLSQGGTVTTSFFAGGNHRTVLAGPSPSTVVFANPASSRFQELDITGVSASLTMGSSVTVAGQLIATPISGNGPVVTGTGTLTAGGADVSALSGSTAITFDGVPLVLSGGNLAALSRVTFQNQNPNGTALTVNNVGQPSAFLFGELTFTTALSAGGFHLVANDLDGPTPNPLTINVLSSTPASGAGVSNVTNGAVINWPPVGTTFTWDGSASTDWNDPANWDQNAVPSAIDDVILVPITNQPVLTSSVVVNSVSSNTGSILQLAGFVLVVNGDLALDGTITDGVGGAGVTLTGVGRLARGSVSAEVAVVGSYTLNGNFIVSGNLSVQGSLSLETFTAQVGGNFVTLGNGVLVQIVAGSLLDVAGDAIFSGGSTNGLLKAGTLQVAGAFNQLASNSTQSFAADPGHLTVIAMLGNPATVFFQTPGGAGFSHFGDLSEDQFGATITLDSDVTILGTLSGGDGFGGTLVGSSCPTVLTLTSYSTSGPLNLDCVQLVIDDPTGVNQFDFNGITFANLPTDVTQLTVRHPGLGAGALGFFGTVTFVPLTTGDTGFYIEAIDTDGAATADLTISFSSGTNVTNGPSFTNAIPPVTVIWP